MSEIGPMYGHLYWVSDSGNVYPHNPRLVLQVPFLVLKAKSGFTV